MTSAHVSTNVVGGRTSAAASAAYDRARRALEAAGDAYARAASSWSQAALQCSGAASQATWCPAQANPMQAAAAHRSVDMRALTDRCTARQGTCSSLARECRLLADLLARVSGIYAQAELEARNASNRRVRTLAMLAPKATALVVGASAAVGGIVAGSTDGPGFAALGASRATARIQEGVVAAVGTAVAGSPLLVGSGTSGAVNEGLVALAPAAATVNDLLQGNDLAVRQVDAGDAQPVGQVASVADALHGLRSLGEANGRGDGGLSYGTIAISRYEQPDGSSSWLVTIPGTDGHADSPFGWIQNVEAMSADPARRREADSVRMVAEAMEQAGIGEHEPVTLVGHSQGGIVAAAIASDWTDRFTVEHVITAGSPVAGHPVASGTAVTSIEMDDELVAALDGCANPATQEWLTVRGHVEDGEHAADRLLGTTVVEDADGPTEFTHNLKYHEAAWRNATDLGSPAVRERDTLVSRSLSGTYAGTTYWQGRMGRHGDQDD